MQRRESTTSRRSRISRAFVVSSVFHKSFPPGCSLGSVLGVWAIPVLFVFARRTPVHFGVVWREVIHLMIPLAAFAHRDLPATVRLIDGQPCFSVAWDSPTRTPNHALQRTRRGRLGCNLGLHVRRFAELFVRQSHAHTSAVLDFCGASQARHRTAIAFLPTEIWLASKRMALKCVAAKRELPARYYAYQMDESVFATSVTLF